MFSNDIREISGITSSAALFSTLCMGCLGAWESKQKTERMKIKMSYMTCPVIMANKPHVDNHFGEMRHWCQCPYAKSQTGMSQTPRADKNTWLVRMWHQNSHIQEAGMSLWLGHSLGLCGGFDFAIFTVVQRKTVESFGNLFVVRAR